MTWFWSFWVLTAAVAMRPLCLALRNREKALEFPVIASLMWSYIYVLLPLQLVFSGDSGLSEEALTVGQLTALVAFVALQMGWGMRWRLTRDLYRATEPRWNYQRLWSMGLALQAIGLAGFYTFLGSGRSFEETSGYWYMLFHLCYPGISLCVVVLVLRSGARTVFNYGILLVAAGLIFVPFLLGARRGPTFTMLVALTFSYLVCRERGVSVYKVALVVGGAGLLMLFLVAARSVTYHDGSWADALRTVNVRSAVEDRGKRTSDNEFVNHAVQIEANRETGFYQYGTAHLCILLNAIPRGLWPEKPSRGQGLFTDAVENHVTEVMHNLGSGGAIAAVADSFNNYGWGFPIFWWVAGWVLGFVYERAVGAGGLRWKLRYVGLVYASHWFIAQSLAEAFVPAVIYQAAYWGVFAVAREPACAEASARRGVKALKRGNVRT